MCNKYCNLASTSADFCRACGTICQPVLILQDPVTVPETPKDLWLSRVPPHGFSLWSSEDLDNLLLGLSLQMLEQEDKRCGGRYLKKI